MLRRIASKLGKGALALAAALLVLGVGAAGLPELFGLRSEAVASRWPLPSLAVAQPTAQVLPGHWVLFADQGQQARLYRVLALQRSDGRQTLVLADAGSGQPLPSPVVATGEMLVARAVVPWLGYGQLLLADWAGRLGTLLALGLLLVWLSWLGVRSSLPAAAQPEEGEAEALAEEGPVALPMAPGEEVAVAAAEDGGEAREEVSPAPAPWPEPAAEAPPTPVPATVGAQAGPAQEDAPLDNDLLAIFRKVASQVRERTLAAEVEEVPIQELVAELQALRQRLRS